MPRSLSVIYCCGTCTTEERTVQVPARREGEDVTRWTEMCVVMSVYLHHRIHSPACRSEEIKQVKVPTTEGMPLGELPNLN